MVNKLLNARLSAVTPTDHAIALWTILSNNWTTSTGYSPPAASTIKFDTKFGAFKGKSNYVIVENMPTMIKSQVLGNTRYQYEDKKRIQILCHGPSAKNNKWLIEKHIDSILNGNPTILQTTYGIDFVSISDFTEIPSETEDMKTNMTPNITDQTARSFATVTLQYETYATTA
jgi:hypothetical protein